METFRSVSPRERILYLKALPFTDSLRADDVSLAAYHMQERSFQSGDYVLEQDEPIDGMYLLREGRVSLHQEGERVRELEAPARIGLIGLLAGGDLKHGYAAAPGDIRAETALETLVLPADLLGHVLQSNVSFLLSLMRWIADQLLGDRPEQLMSSACASLLDDPGAELTLADRLQWLHRSVLFEETNLEALLELARHQEVVRASDGRHLWRRGESADRILSLVYGCISVSSTDEPSDAARRLRIRGQEFVGLLEALADQTRSVSAVADGDVVALELQLDVLLEVLEDHPSMAFDLIRTLSAWALGHRWREKGGEHSSVPVASATSTETEVNLEPLVGLE